MSLFVGCRSAMRAVPVALRCCCPRQQARPAPFKLGSPQRELLRLCPHGHVAGEQDAGEQEQDAGEQGISSSARATSGSTGPRVLRSLNRLVLRRVPCAHGFWFQWCHVQSIQSDVGCFSLWNVRVGLSAGTYFKRVQVVLVYRTFYCKESTLSDNIWWHQPWRQGVPKSATLEEGGGVDSTSFLT
eukprot:COSAG01_NODE_8181_length_2887_cov_91.439383_3_plen_186_part_00